jgi:hypothetical protein
MLLWSIEETAGFDTAWATLDAEAGTLRAEGRTSGLRPEPYWLTYAFESGPEFVTRRMRVEARDGAGSTTLDLLRGDDGWTVNGELRPDLDATLDLDLGGCPLTNTMPILRHRLHEGPGDATFLMAFIEVPSLAVVPSTQRYTHVRRLEDGSSVVRYRSGSFESDLTIDPDGFVIDYPQLGRRVGETSASPRAAGSTIGRRDR